jgi:hypothetical protein
MEKNEKICLILLFGSIFFVGPVAAAAAISTISPGNMVFIGEQGLDITLAMEGDTRIGWWASGASIATSSPDNTVSISNPTSFSIPQNLFGSRNGVWYHLDPTGKANGTAFTVIDPQLDIRVEDTTASVDVTDKWIPIDDEIRFRIDTNLAQMTQRTGVNSVPVTIKVQAPGGGVFSSLVSKAGATTSIVDYAVTTTPQYTNSIWGTSNRDLYSPGTYTIWAECNVNSMKDNYGVTGKTVSRQVTALNQDRNPLIGVSTKTITPTTQVTIIPSVSLTVRSTLVPPVTPSETTPLTTTPAPIFNATPSTSSVTLPETSQTTPTKASGFGMALSFGAMMSVLIISHRKKIKSGYRQIHKIL